MLTEVSVEQLKTQFVDSGKLFQEDFDEIVNTTPKTAYITWLAKKVADKIIKTEDIYKYKKYFNIFDRRKKEYPFADINQYKTQNDLSQFISKSVEIADKESKDVSQQKGVSKEDKYKEFYIGSVDGFKVYELPQGRKDLYGASCELGSGTEWCTATGKTREHFDHYISKDSLFIFIKSDEKYQFSYETDSFMDKNDVNVLKKNHLNFFKFIKDYNPKYKIPLELKILNNNLGPITDEDLKVENNLNLSNTPITTLPDNLKVEGSLNLNNTLITTLPDNLKVKWDLNLSNTPITTLPDNLKVERDLNLNNTLITTLPDNLKVGGNLDLSNTLITTLPDDLKVGRSLVLNDTPITTLPDNLKVGGNLHLSNCKYIKTLPDNLKVEGSLYLNYTPITTLPDNLKVGDDLNLSYTLITTLPDNLKVGRSLYLNNTPISKKYTAAQLKQMYSGIKEKIII